MSVLYIHILTIHTILDCVFCTKSIVLFYWNGASCLSRQSIDTIFLDMKRTACFYILLINITDALDYL